MRFSTNTDHNELLTIWARNELLLERVLPPIQSSQMALLLLAPLGVVVAA
jgi:hypothetical protein